MTPQEIADYKRAWQPGITLGFHSDIERQVKDWLKAHCEKHQYHIYKWSDVYEHSVGFESEADVERFIQGMRDSKKDQFIRR